jgi:hypothetical protein
MAPEVAWELSSNEPLETKLAAFAEPVTAKNDKAEKQTKAAVRKGESISNL